MYFDQRLCFFHQKVESQDQLFQMMTDKMLEAGCVKENYYEGISNREKEYPTGLLVNQTGFAIPHTDSERVNKSQICFLSLDEPIEFEDMVDKSHKISVLYYFTHNNPLFYISLIKVYRHILGSHCSHHNFQFS